MFSRRQLLLGGPAAALAGPGYRPVLGAQIYVWTQQFAKEKKSLADGLQEALPAIRRAGYRRVSLTGQFFQPGLRAGTAALLKSTGLELPDAYSGGPMHERGLAEKTIADTLEIAQVAQACGARTLTFNANPKQEGKNDAELANQAKYLNVLGEKLRARRMELLIHQHAPEMRDGAREWRHELRNTDPALVKFCLDVDWIKRGGQDPMTLLAECAPRLRSLHLRSARNGVWMEEFAQGDVDYGEVAGFLRKAGFDGLLLIELAYEKDTVVTRPLEENLRRSRRYAERVFGL